MTTNIILGSQSRGQIPLQAQELVKHSEITALIKKIFAKFCKQDSGHEARIDACCFRIESLTETLGVTLEKVHQLVNNTLKNHSFHENNCWTLYYSIHHQTATFRKRNPRYEDHVSTDIAQAKMTRQQIVNMVCMKQLEKLEKISALASLEEVELTASVVEKGTSIVLTEKDLKKNFSITSLSYREENTEIFTSAYKISS